MPETDAEIRKRWTAKLKTRLANLAAAKHSLAIAKAQVKATAEAVARAKRVIAKHASKPGAPVLWHPDAIRLEYASAGPLTVGKPKLVWHTTEGVSLPSYSGSAPHFTFDSKSGKLWQHIALNEAAKSLIHPAACETNRAHAIQVELIGFAKDTAGWSDAQYARIAELARFIERNTGVKRACGVTFSLNATRFAPAAWLSYNGHCGHEHVPGNDHVDPGAFLIGKVLA